MTKKHRRELSINTKEIDGNPPTKSRRTADQSSSLLLNDGTNSSHPLHREQRSILKVKRDYYALWHIKDGRIKDPEKINKILEQVNSKITLVERIINDFNEYTNNSYNQVETSMNTAYKKQSKNDKTWPDAMRAAAQDIERWLQENRKKHEEYQEAVEKPRKQICHLVASIDNDDTRETYTERIAGLNQNIEASKANSLSIRSQLEASYQETLELLDPGLAPHSSESNMTIAKQERTATEKLRFAPKITVRGIASTQEMAIQSEIRELEERLDGKTKNKLSDPERNAALRKISELEALLASFNQEAKDDTDKTARPTTKRDIYIKTEDTERAIDTRESLSEQYALYMTNKEDDDKDRTPFEEFKAVLKTINKILKASDVEDDISQIESAEKHIQEWFSDLLDKKEVLEETIMDRHKEQFNAMQQIFEKLQRLQESFPTLQEDTGKALEQSNKRELQINHQKILGILSIYQSYSQPCLDKANDFVRSHQQISLLPLQKWNTSEISSFLTSYSDIREDFNKIKDIYAQALKLAQQIKEALSTFK